MGPYEVFDGNPILTQRDLPDGRSNPVTCAGHADMVQTPGGDWVSVFLACQPYSENYFNTGRQTFFLPVDWSGEWPVILEKGGDWFFWPYRMRPQKVKDKPKEQ